MSRGRGRGRGRGKQFGGLESLLPGEPPPPPILTPPPLFPPMEKRPLELRKSQVDTYLLNLKQKLRHHTQQSPFFLKAESEKKEIERYSDRYRLSGSSEIDDFIEWQADWRFFPSELRSDTRKKKRKLTTHRPSLPTKKRARRSSGSREGGGDSSGGKDGDPSEKKVRFSADNEKFDPLSKLDDTPVKGEKEVEEGEKEGEEEEVTEEIYDEEIEEEDTDYNVTYFDNGEDYGGDEEEALEEGPCY